MASPAPALLELLRAVDARWPERAKASDGIMGDAAHAARASDHNQGDALDITHDEEHGPDLEALADALMGDERVHYVIWDRRIRNRAYEGGAWRNYDGANPHTKHLHVSIHPEQREDTRPWALSATSPARSRLGIGLVFAGLGLAVLGVLAWGRPAQPPV